MTGFNRLMQETIAENAEKSLEERLGKVYDLLAADAVEDDIEDYFEAQAEALLDG